MAQTIYEDAQDGLTDGWTITDFSPSGATVNNVFDDNLSSNVIELDGTGSSTANAYLLGGFGSSTGWNNTSEFTLSFRLRTDVRYIINVRLLTDSGARYLRYKNTDISGTRIGNTIDIGLGSSTADGNWQVFTRDLQQDLNTGEPGRTITAVHGILIRGQMRLDDITLSDPGSPSTNMPPLANAGTDRIFTQADPQILDGSGSNDTDGSIIAYEWRESGNLIATGANPTILPALASGAYTVELTVTDDDLATSTDTVQVTVSDGNAPPVANAGPDIDVAVGAPQILDGLSSRDTDGTITSFRWRESGNLIAAGANPTISPALAEGVYTIELTVIDDAGATATDTVQLTVSADNNAPPIADAGANVTVTQGNAQILNGTASSDNDGTISSYEWRESGTLIATGANPTITPPLPVGVYQIELTVIDDDLATSSDTVSLTVNAPVTSPAGTVYEDAEDGLTNGWVVTDNSPSGASISNVFDSQLGSNVIELDGTGSAKANAFLLGGFSGASAWNNTSQFTLSFRLRSDEPYIINVRLNTTAGTRYVRYKNTDISGTRIGNTVDIGLGSNTDDGNWYEFSRNLQEDLNTGDPSATINAVNGMLIRGHLRLDDITLSDPGSTVTNMPPIADAGADLSFTSGSPQMLNGSASSDADGTITTYQWRESGNLIASGINPTLSPALAAGVYTIELTVIDDDLKAATDTVQVTVNAPDLNLHPIANAGTDTSVTIGTPQVLNGSASSDPDGTITTYQWRESGSLIASGVNPTITPALAEGVYQIELTVIDNDLAVATDIVQVTVSAGNATPVADAGVDISVLAGAPQILNGTASSDSDGTITTYVWRESSNEVATGANPTISPALAEGVYTIELTVTDDAGATATDTVQLTVSADNNAPPVADAGADVTVTQGNAQILNGTASSDNDGTISSYEWRESGTLIATGANPTITPPLPVGVYQIELTVIDDDLATSSDTVSLTVNTPVTSPAGTVYEDAEDGLTNGWVVTDNSPSGASISNVFDSQLGSNVIELDGTGSAKANAFLLGGFSGASAWNNTSQFTLSFRLRSDEPYIINVRLNTTAGTRYVRYKNTDISGTRIGNTVDIGLGSNTDDGDWYDFSRNLQEDLNAGDPSTIINAVNGLLIRGHLRLDDIILSDPDSVPGNVQPVANAGEDFNVVAGDLQRLNGSESIDSDGSITAYEWRESGNLIATGITPTISPALDEGIYTVELTVIDDDLATATDTVQMTVIAGNVPPLANAGDDISVTLGEPQVLDGSGSSDSDGSITTYEWRESDNLIATGMNPTLSPPLAVGIYTIELTVIDDDLAEAIDSVQVTVDAPDIPPVANAGADISVLVGDPQLLDGSASSDTDGSITTYEWRLSGALIATGTTTTLSPALEAGVYIIELTVIDDDLLTATDTVQLTVSAVNEPPVANAGEDISVTVGDPQVLDGSASTDADGSITTYEWRVSGDIIATGENPTISPALEEGVYTIELTVLDDGNLSSTDEVQMVVNQIAIETSPKLSNYTLIFSDEFNAPAGSGLNPDNWDTGLLWGPYLPINNEQQLYVDSLGMHSEFGYSPFELTGSTLKITATPTSSTLQPPTRPPEDDPIWKPTDYSEYRFNGPTENGPGYQPEDIDYLSGIITSYGSFKMTHGYVEMRAKLPAGQGLWPAFWLLNVHYVEDVPEIDVMEFLGQDVDTIYHTYHYFDIPSGWRQISTPSFTSSNDDWTQQFHTFGMAWGPTEIIWYVDGVETRRITDSEYTISGQAMYLLANLAVGGNWPGPADGTTSFPATFEIDYIRAYKRRTDAELNLAADYQLMFEDNFNTDFLDPDKWNTHFLWGPYQAINEEEQYYVDALGSDTPDQTNTPFVLDNGVLSITARTKDDPQSYPIPQLLPDAEDTIWDDFPSFRQNADYSPGNYTSGIITSYDSFKFSHGYAEIRAKIPSGDGMWPAFWLLNGYYIAQQPEIDIMEARGRTPNEIVHSYHRSANGEMLSELFTTGGGNSVIDYSDDFHTYGVRWQHGRIDWYIDRTLVHTYENPDVGYQLMYVIANLAVGGNFDSVDVDDSKFPASLDIDYIRVYQERHKD